MSADIKSKIIAVVISVIVGLGSFWFASFAKSTSLVALENRVTINEDRAKLYAKKTDLKLILSGLCIIDKRTCGLKKDIR